jgi:hypothetical protein
VWDAIVFEIELFPVAIYHGATPMWTFAATVA